VGSTRCARARRARASEQPGTPRRSQTRRTSTEANAPKSASRVATGTALSRFLDAHGDLIAEAQRTKPAGTPFGGGPYGAYHTHVRILLRELDSTLDIDVLAHVLLAPFRAELYGHLVGGTRAAGRERLLAAVATLLDGLG